MARWQHSSAYLLRLLLQGLQLRLEAGVFLLRCMRLLCSGVLLRIQLLLQFVHLGRQCL
jgi:hypothetical protein